MDALLSEREGAETTVDEEAEEAGEALVWSGEGKGQA